jgi:hypothetical protein
VLQQGDRPRGGSIRDARRWKHKWLHRKA